jgi:MFS transporter, DHA2 family, multidrug resistance protein
MIGLALGFPVTRWLAARYGDYRVYGAALIAYAFLSLLCASSGTIWSFVPLRIGLGFAGGVILPVGQAILLSEYPPERRTLGVGIWGVLSMMPFTVGVFMGGWWAEFFGWRAMFLSNAVIALTVAGVAGSLLYSRRIKRHISRFDGMGFFCSLSFSSACRLFSIKAMISIGLPRQSLRARLSWSSPPCLASSYGNWANVIPRST